MKKGSVHFPFWRGSPVEDGGHSPQSRHPVHLVHFCPEGGGPGAVAEAGSWLDEENRRRTRGRNRSSVIDSSERDATRRPPAARARSRLHFASLRNPDKEGETISNSINTTPVTVDVTSQKADLVAAYEALIDGIKTMLVGVDPIVLGAGSSSVSMTQASILTQLQQRVDAANATKDARKTLAKLVAAERELDAQVRPLRAALKRFLVARLGPNNPDLQKLGFTQNRRPRKTVKSKAQALDKAQATRKTRSTMGRQQKAALTAVAPVQATAPSPAPAPTVTTPPHGNGTPS